MTSIREVLARNLKENRKKCGFTQEQLAEKADVSTHYIAMIETCNTFPKPEMLERLALVMEIEPYDLFYMPPSALAAAETALEKLQETVTTNIEKAVSEAVEKVIKEQYKANKIK